MSSEPRLLLFDIDQTLIFTAGAGMRSLARAVRSVTGRSVEDHGVHPGGKTDPVILAEILRAVDGPHHADVEADVWRHYAQYLGEEMQCDDARRVMKPGIPRLLEVLAASPRAFLALLTGNLEVTARIKLAGFELNRYFPVGAFGSDCHDRCRLGEVALRRAVVHYRQRFTPAQTWVIGDTDRDVAAASALGARCLAVATGHQSADDLRAAGADLVLRDLGDVDRVARILLA